MIEPEMMEKLLINYLKKHNIYDNNKSWCVKYSSLGGRGLHAIRDIKQGELIFTDKPLIIGPRCYNKYLPMCINCYKSDCTLFSCDNGCGLPICSNDCENSIKHINSECKYLNNLQVTCGSMWSMELLQTVVPIRALSLNDDEKKLLNGMECHDGPGHGREIELLKKNISNIINEDDEKYMKKVCRIFDTNAFETVLIIDGKTSISLRGLFPLGALQNHSCTPNTRHYFTNNNVMITKASRDIKAGEELTMTYTDLLWDTSLRRRYLIASKHFECNCKRCCDPLELGSQIGAMRCANIDCYGFIYPDEPLNFETSWSCRECFKKITNRQIKVIRSGIKSIIDPILLESPRKLLNFIETELLTLVPPTNHIMLDMKFQLTEKELELKEKYCYDLLDIMDHLNLGDHQKKGLILYELYCTINEKLRRDKNLIIKKNNDKIIDKILEILKDDISAPLDLKNFQDV
ncbi:hypothetical protein HCN44_005307 [Aphidius gifuensis]|uniref:SET domain-containing protein n=1 Tax=Aphidius gifuensis TaxID=684658 RepID=A0A834Y2W5_APHGI|nr:hypothetical protein HCN44_005307 [Aphidius gifuensis]